MKDADLKKCPFCGSAPSTGIEIATTVGGAGEIDFYIRCPICGVEKNKRLAVNATSRFYDIELAIIQAAELWNRRAE